MVWVDLGFRAWDLGFRVQTLGFRKFNWVFEGLGPKG